MSEAEIRKAEKIWNDLPKDYRKHLTNLVIGMKIATGQLVVQHKGGYTKKE